MGFFLPKFALAANVTTRDKKAADASLTNSRGAAVVRRKIETVDRALIREVSWHPSAVPGPGSAAAFATKVPMFLHPPKYECED